MTTPSPAWVRKRDGRLAPFEADRINQALFAVTESCGRADPFLARELADVVVHFLAEECEGTTPTTETVADVVVKVLGELKHHAIASRFAEYAEQKNRNGTVTMVEPASRAGAVFQYDPTAGFETVRDECLRNYSLCTVFTRDLAAAHREGLIVLGGLETPGELESCRIDLGIFDGTLERFSTLTEAGCRTAAFDGVEHALARDEKLTAKALVDELALALRVTGCSAVLNVNAPPPLWAREPEEPLFVGTYTKADSKRLQQLSLTVSEAVLGGDSPALGRLGLYWHLTEPDFTEAARERLLRLAQFALQSNRLAFVFDRLRASVMLAEGVSRSCPSVLLRVGLNLPRLAGLPGELESEVETGADAVSEEASRFLARLRSLARIALSAGVQKRAFLRRLVVDRPALGQGLRIERGALLAIPMGLDETVWTLMGKHIHESGAARRFATEIVKQLAEVLSTEGRSVGLETCLDAALEVGPTNWDRLATIAVAGVGTVVVGVPSDPPSAEKVAELLKVAWGKTEIRRVRFARFRSESSQMVFDPEECASANHKGDRSDVE